MFSHRATSWWFAFAILFVPVQATFAQHLWWNADGMNEATCVYGQITVLATHSGTYFCGINWHPGEAGGGYCGIQQNDGEEKRTIFSIWDTSPELHPSVIAADPNTQHHRFGGEGEGGHTHMLWPWKLGEKFEFFVAKSPGENDTTLARYYVFDRSSKMWIHSATVSSPNGGHAEIANFSGGGICSFLENYTGQDKSAPRIAMYRLWIGTTPQNLRPLIHSGGDGKWGTLHDNYFLAGGSDENLSAEFSKLEPVYGKPVYGGGAVPPAAISAKPVDPDVVSALEHLPSAPPAD